MRVLTCLLVLVMACGGGGNTDGEAPEIATFTATPDTIPVSTPTSITWAWTFSNDPEAPECAIDGIGPVTSGSSTEVTLAASVTYTLRCSNAAGEGTAFTLVNVALDPVAPAIASLDASPAQLLVNTPTDVTFTWTYAEPPVPLPTCMLDNGVGAVMNGVAKSVTLSATTDLTLTCTNSEGMDTEMVTLTTVAAPVAPDIATFAPDPATVVEDTATMVTWNWTYTGTPTPLPACTIDNGVGAVTPGTQTSVTLAANTTYTLSCNNTAGSDTAMATITTMAAQVAPDLATFTATPSSVDSGVQTAITWAWTYANTPSPAPTCTIDMGVGAMTSGGTSDVTIAAPTTYTLTCTNAAGSDTATTDITIN